ncbi:MAG TPA: hypothetical protein VKA06_10615, partial [Spirochaetia bacterium]|nr:hypothetical protein [Spirochaetia bacterium]
MQLRGPLTEQIHHLEEQPAGKIEELVRGVLDPSVEDRRRRFDAKRLRQLEHRVEEPIYRGDSVRPPVALVRREAHEQANGR